MKKTTRIDKIKVSGYSLLEDTLLNPDFYREILRSTRSILREFAYTMVMFLIIFSVFYFTAFHGECSMRLMAGSGGTAYRRLYMKEQSFFNLVLYRKSWYDLAENTPNFDSSGYNGGMLVRWRGFGYIWTWEEPFAVVY